MALSKEEISKRQVERRKARRKAEGQSYVRIDTTPETKAAWQAYARYKGIPLATLIRQCLAESMARDNWNAQPDEESTQP